MNDTCTKYISRIMLVFFFVFAGIGVFAQTYTATPVETGKYYCAMAKDQSNNVYVVRYNAPTTSYQVVKYPGGNGPEQVLYTGLVSNPNEVYSWGLAVNDFGDVFVTNPEIVQNWQIIKLAAPSYNTPQVIHSGNFYSALAVDNSNNLLSLEYNGASNTFDVVRYQFGAEQLNGLPVYSGLPYPAGSTSYPTNIVVDSHDNIYITDFLENHGGGAITKLTAPGFTPTVLATGRSFTTLAIDANDNFYTTEANDTPEFQVVKYTDLTKPGEVLYTGLHFKPLFYPWGMAVMPNEDILVNDGATGGYLYKLSPPPLLVTSVTRANASPTTASAVTFNVTFSRAITGVTTGTFSLATGGPVGASIASVTGSGATYTVVVNTGVNDGTIKLNVTGTTVPPIANVPYTTGEVYTIDRTPPSGSITINGGALYTNNTGVLLSLTSSDASAPVLMSVSNTLTFGADEAFATTKAWTLNAVDGVQTVYVRYKDALGTTSVYSKQITLDRIKPSAYIITAPDPITASGNAPFQFGADDPNATFEAKLDGGAYVPATSPLTYTGLADGPHSFMVRAIDQAGNISDPDPYSWIVDKTGPVITAVAVPVSSYYRAGQQLDFIVKYNEPVIVTNIAGNPYINIIIGLDAYQVPYVSGSGTNELLFSYTVADGQMDNDGIFVNPQVQNNSGFIQDAVGNNASTNLNNIASTTGVRVNTSIPSVALSTTAPTYYNAPFTVTATFSEPVTGVIAADFNVIGATVSNLSTTDNITYTVLISPSGDGPFTISLPSSAAVNIGGNPNTPSNILNHVHDQTRPSVTKVEVPADGYYKAGSTLAFKVNFSELLNVTGSPYLDLTIGAANRHATYVSGDGTSVLTFSYTVQAGENDNDGIVVNSLQLNGGTLKDVATNDVTATLQNIDPTTGVKVNTSIPAVSVSSTAPAIVSGPYTVNIDFSEAVSGFIFTDINLSGATLGNFQALSGSSYSVMVIPTTEGIVSINVPANIAVNIGGNNNTASNTVTRIYDVTPPRITHISVPPNGYYNATSTLTFTVQFSENVSVNNSPVLNLTIGSVSKQATYVSSNNDEIVFSYPIADGDMDGDGIEVNSLSLNGGTILDIANNNADLTLHNVDATTGIFVNTQHPTVALSTAAPSLVNAPFTIKAVFSEAVITLTDTDFSVTNGTVSNVQSTNNITYTALVTPTADGAISVSIPANSVSNIGDNGNTASNTLNFTYDGTAPVVAAVAVPPNGYYKAGEVLSFIVRFDGDIYLDQTGGVPTLGLTIGSTSVNAELESVSNNELSFRYTVLDGQLDMNGIEITSLALNGATIKDAATNNADLTLNNVGNTVAVRVNTIHPTVSITSASAANLNTPFQITVTFSENITGLTSSDLVVGNATVGPLTVIDNANYLLTVVPIAEGPVSVSLPADAAVNIGDNGNQASNTLTRIYDITRPVVDSVTVPTNGYYKAGDVMNFTVYLSEDIAIGLTGGSPVLAINIGGNAVNAAYTNTVGTNAVSFSYTVVNGNQDMDGITVDALTLNGATIKDAATNDAQLALHGVKPTTGVKVNTTHPSVILSTTANVIVNAPFSITATFSEAVTDLTAADFATTNATVSSLNTTDGITYTLLVTPDADGVASVALPANAAFNVGSNGNTASNTININYDATAPAVNAVFVPINGYYKQGDVMNFIVFFNENINLNNSGGAPYLNVTLGSGTVRAGYTVATANSLSFSYTVQPGDMDLDGITVSSFVANGSTIKDDAGNNANLTLNNIANTSQVFVHTGTPSVTLSTAAAPRVNAPFTITATFNEGVTGLTAADFDITNGTAASLQTTDNIVYTIEVTPIAQGAVTIQLPAAQAQNVISNGNTVSNTISVTFDNIAPVVDMGLSFQVLERSTPGTQVGKVTATDASGIFQDWKIISDDSNGAFTIDATGNIKVLDQALLNAKVNNTVTLNVNVSDGLNTSTAATVTVKVLPLNLAPTFNMISSEDACPGKETHIQVTGASATEADQTYGFTITSDKAIFDELSISAQGVITYQLKADATGTAAVTVTIKDNGGTANGGIDAFSQTFNITVATLGNVNITSDKGSSISKGDIIHLTADGGSIYEWDNAAGIISGQHTAVLEARPMETTTYHVTVSNAAGCSNTAEFTVSVIEDFKVDATNILSPNGDGINDKWIIRNLDSYPDNEVTIYDRAGRVVYTRRNYSNDWSGTTNGTPLSEGTYYYVLKIEGGAKTAKGFITIIRNNR